MNRLIVKPKPRARAAPVRCAQVATLFVDLTKPGRSRPQVPFDRSALEAIREFMAAFASRSGWDERMATRLHAVSEKTSLTPLAGDEAGA